MLVLTVCYAAMLATIVLLADVGEARLILGHVHQFPFGDKACHFLLVGILSLLLSVTLSRRRPRHRLLIVATTVVVLSAAASLEEFSQSLLVHRQFDTADMASNVAGIVFFGCIALLLPLRRPLCNASPAP